MNLPPFPKGWLERYEYIAAHGLDVDNLPEPWNSEQFFPPASELPAAQINQVFPEREVN